MAEETSEKEPRRPGAVSYLTDAQKLSTNIEKRHYDLLQAYCRKHRVSMAEATRRAIEFLAEKDGLTG